MNRNHPIRRALRARGLEHLAPRTLFWWQHHENAAAPYGNPWAWRCGGAQQWAATRDGDAAGKTIFDPRTRRIEIAPAGQVGFGAPQEPARTQLQKRSLLTGGVTAPTGWTLTDASGASSAGAPSLLGARDGAQAWRTQAAGGQMYLDGPAVTFAANTRYALSLWIEDLDFGSGNALLATLSDASFVASGSPQILAGDADVTGLPARIVRLFTTNGSGGSAALRIGAGVGGAAVCDVTVSRPQLEAGDYASSFVPNGTDATKARPADVMRWTDAAFFTRAAAAGTLLWVGRSPYAASDLSVLERLVALNEGTTTNNRIMLYGNETLDRLTSQIRNGAGSTVMQLDAGALGNFPRISEIAAAVTWRAAGGAFYANGVQEGTTGAMTPPSALDLLELGSSDSANTRSGSEHFLAAVFEGALSDLEARNLTLNAGRWIWPA